MNDKKIASYLVIFTFNDNTQFKTSYLNFEYGYKISISALKKYQSIVKTMTIAKYNIDRHYTFDYLIFAYSNGQIKFNGTPETKQALNIRNADIILRRVN